MATFITKRYNFGHERRVQTPQPPIAGTASSMSSQIVAANNDRTGLVVINLSANTVSLGLGNDAVLYGGITLVPNSAWEMDQYTFCVDAVTAIASADASKLSIQEFTI